MYPCSVCHASFPTRHKRDCHNRSHRNRLKVFYEATGRRELLRRNSEGRYECVTKGCGKTSQREEVIRRHGKTCRQKIQIVEEEQLQNILGAVPTCESHKQGLDLHFIQAAGWCHIITQEHSLAMRSLLTCRDPSRECILQEQFNTLVQSYNQLPIGLSPHPNKDLQLHPSSELLYQSVFMSVCNFLWNVREGQKACKEGDKVPVWVWSCLYNVDGVEACMTEWEKQPKTALLAKVMVLLSHAPLTQHGKRSPLYIWTAIQALTKGGVYTTATIASKGVARLLYCLCVSHCFYHTQTPVIGNRECTAEVEFELSQSLVQRWTKDYCSPTTSLGTLRRIINVAGKLHQLRRKEEGDR